MGTLISIIIWSTIGYLCGWSDGDVQERKGLIRLIVYLLAMIAILVVVLHINKGALV